MISSLFMRYLKSCETEERHRDEMLKTHYYKGTYRQVYESVEKLIIQDPKYQLMHVSKERGEFAIRLKNRKDFSLIMTVVAVKPLEVAVDIHISTESFSILGTYPKLKLEVTSLYRELNKKMTFIGTGRSI